MTVSRTTAWRICCATTPTFAPVLLEPQPQAFAALQQLWRDVPRITPIEAALATGCGERPLYVIADHRKHLHPFAGQVASFSRAHVENECNRYVWRPSEDFVISVPVRTVDWRTLMVQHGPFDLVAIDAEGYDGEILHQMDLSRQSPGLILYEHRHLDKHCGRSAYACSSAPAISSGR